MLDAAERPAGPFEDAGDVEAERAVGVDRFEVRRAEVGDGRLAQVVALGLVGVDGVLEVARRGVDAGIDDQRVAVGLDGLVVVVGVADCAAVGEEDKPAEVVQGLAPVELAADTPAEGFVGEPAQGMHRPQQFPVLDKGLCQWVLAGAGLEAGHEQGGRDITELERAADPQQVVPVLGDEVDLGVLGKKGAGLGQRR